MESIITYLLKSILISGIMMTYYWIFLRNRKINVFNRYFLLLTLFASLLLPFFQFSFAIKQNADIPIYTIPTLLNPQLNSQETDISTILSITSIVCVWVSIILISFSSYRIAWMYKVKHTHHITRLGEVDFIQTELKEAPFTFLNNLFWKQSIALEDSSAQKIFRHEMAHIRQKHSVDNLFAQAVLCVFWMNPFYWLLRKELNIVHEFLADEEAIEAGDLSSFAEMLLRSYNAGTYLTPLHAFSNSPIKRRIMMITKTPGTSTFKKWIPLPFLASILTVISCSVDKDELSLMSTNTQQIKEDSKAKAILSKIKKADDFSSQSRYPILTSYKSSLQSEETKTEAIIAKLQNTEGNSSPQTSRLILTSIDRDKKLFNLQVDDGRIEKNFHITVNGDNDPSSSN